MMAETGAATPIELFASLGRSLQAQPLFRERIILLLISNWEGFARLPDSIQPQEEETREIWVN